MAELWDQQPGESGPAFEAFQVYRDAGPSRTVPGAYRATQRQKGGNSRAGSQKQAPGSWNKWAKVNNWRERAAAFDARGARIEAKATEAVIARVASDRAAKVLEQERMEHHLSTLLFAKAIEMLEVAVVKRREVVVAGPNGCKQTVIQEPMKWNFGTLARVVQAAQQLGRAGLNMPIRIDPAVTDEAPYFDTSGEMETSAGPGQVPAMPADVRNKPTMGITAIGPAGEGLIQPTKARPEKRG